MDGITIEQWQAEHLRRMEQHADRIGRELAQPLYECIEHPEWGALNAYRAGRKVGATPDKIRRAAATGGTGGFLHWCPAGERRKFSALNFDGRTCCQKVQCVETGVTYPSVKSACEAHGLKSRYSIFYAIRNNWRAGGYHWRRVGKRPRAVLSRKPKERAEAA